MSQQPTFVVYLIVFVKIDVFMSLLYLQSPPPKMPKHTPTPGIGVGPGGPLAGLHGFGAHLPPLPGIPTSVGVHPTPLSALTAAARSAPGGVPVSAAGVTPGGLPPPPPGVTGGGGGGGTMGPIRRRLTEKAPLPMTNGEKNEIHKLLTEPDTLVPNSVMA